MTEDKKIRPRAINGRRFNTNWRSFAIMARMCHDLCGSQIGYLSEVSELPYMALELRGAFKLPLGDGVLTRIGAYS